MSILTFESRGLTYESRNRNIRWQNSRYVTKNDNQVQFA